MKRLVNTVCRRFRRQPGPTPPWCGPAHWYDTLSPYEREHGHLVILMPPQWGHGSRHWYAKALGQIRNPLQEDQWRLGRDPQLVGIGLWSE